MIRVFLTDVDGVLTDSTYLVLPDGSKAKRFNTRDFCGMSQLHKAGCHIGVLTGDDPNMCVLSQIRRTMPYAILHEGVKNKKQDAAKLISDWGFTWEEVAFIGDDTNDLELLSTVGLPACPRDAVSSIQELVMSHPDGVIIPYPGGGGCVRDFTDLIRATWYNGVK